MSVSVSPDACFKLFEFIKVFGYSYGEELNLNFCFASLENVTLPA